MKKNRLSREERKKALQERTATNVNNSDGYSNSSNVLNIAGKDIKFFKPKKGRVKMDILPYIIETKNDPSGMKPGLENYVLEYWVHYGVGPEEGAFLCRKKTFNKPCPICEELQALKNKGAEKDEIDALKPKQRCLYNIIDKNDPDSGIQLFEVSYFLFEKELREEAQADQDGDIITFADLEDGATIQCRASAESMGGNEFMKYKSFSFLERKPYPESILDETISLDALLSIPTYEQVRDAFHGVESSDIDSDNDDYDEESPKKESKKKKIKEDVPPFDEDDEEEAPPRKSKSIKKEIVEDGEEEDEEEDEEEKLPSKKEKKSKQACPAGGTFGQDCDELDDCEECKLWEKCADAQEKLEEEDE